jgi:cytosine permease
MSDLNTKSQKEIKQDVKVDEDYPLDHVPASARRSLLSVSAVLIGFTFFTPTMASGAQLGAAFPFDQLLVIIIGGSLILGFYVASMCAIGAKTGLTAVLQSKYTFGTIGAKWSDIILGGTQIFWYAITAQYMGVLFASALGMDGKGWEILWIIIWGIIMGATALFGVRAMTIVSYVAIPLMALLMIMVMVLAIREVGSLDAIREIAPTSEMSIASAITVIVGTFASGGTQAGNWARFCRSAKAAFIAGLLGFLVGNGIMIFSGMLGGLVFGTGDLIELMISMGIIFWALIILTLNIWTTNNATAYAFGMAGSEFFNKANKTPFIVGGIIIALIMACLNILNVFMPMLGLLGTFVPPLGGAMIGDFLFVYKRKIPKLQYIHFKTVRPGPWIAYIIACIVAYFTGQVGIGIPSLQGIILGIILVPVIHIILTKCGVNDDHPVDEGAEYV